MKRSYTRFKWRRDDDHEYTSMRTLDCTSNEIVYDSEAYMDTIFAERTYTYDENHNLIKVRSM